MSADATKKRRRWILASGINAIITDVRIEVFAHDGTRTARGERAKLLPGESFSVARAIQVIHRSE